MSIEDRVTSRIRVTIVDILAAVVPGFLWASIFIGSFDYLRAQLCATPDGPLKTLTMRFDTYPESIAFIMVSLLWGYIAYAVATEAAQPITAFILRKIMFRLRRPWDTFKVYSMPGYSPEFLRNDFVFPYRKDFEESTILKKVESILEQNGLNPNEKLPGHQPFSSAKRLLRQWRSEHWEECETREAQVRMLASICVALFASVLFGLVGFALFFVRYCRSDNASLYLFCWPFISLALLALTCLAFDRERREEVGYVYLMLYLEATAGRKAAP